MTALSTPEFEAKRDAVRARFAENHVAFERKILDLAADGAAAAETVESMSPDEFLSRLRVLDGSFAPEDAEAKGRAAKTDHQG